MSLRLMGVRQCETVEDPVVIPNHWPKTDVHVHWVLINLGMASLEMLTNAGKMGKIHSG